MMHSALLQSHKKGRVLASADFARLEVSRGAKRARKRRRVSADQHGLEKQNVDGRVDAARRRRTIAGAGEVYLLSRRCRGVIDGTSKAAKPNKIKCFPIVVYVTKQIKQERRGGPAVGSVELHLASYLFPRSISPRSLVCRPAFLFKKCMSLIPVLEAMK